MIATTQAERRIGRSVPTAVKASDHFKRYKKEERTDIRQLEVKGDEKQRLEQTREMLRSMTTDQVKQIIEWYENLTVFEALILAKKQGYLIVPNSIHDRIVNETEDEKYLEQNYPAWTGTAIIYERPDKPFGDKIVFTWKADDKVQYTITFNVPKKYQGKKNCALVLEHPDFDLVDLGNNNYELKVADEKNIHLIKNVPKQDGWYLTDNKHKIPTGKEADESNKDARYLWRNNNAFLGSLVRTDFYVDRRRVVCAVFRQDLGYGVAMVPLAAATKQSD